VLFYRWSRDSRHPDPKSHRKPLSLSCTASPSSRTNWRAPGNVLAGQCRERNTQDSSRREFPGTEGVRSDSNRKARGLRLWVSCDNPEHGGAKTPVSDSLAVYRDSLRSQKVYFLTELVPVHRRGFREKRGEASGGKCRAAGLARWSGMV